MLNPFSGSQIPANPRSDSRVEEQGLRRQRPQSPQAGLSPQRGPLRWREIQGASCIDMVRSQVNNDRQLVDTPEGLFASLVEVRSDGIVALVHDTARESVYSPRHDTNMLAGLSDTNFCRFLMRTNLIKSVPASDSLTMLSLAYLVLPQVDVERSDDQVASDLLGGSHAFHDYASACWAIHVQTDIQKRGEASESTNDSGGATAIDSFDVLQETLEALIDAHWSDTSKPLAVCKTLQEALSPLAASENYVQIAQAIAWSKKQLGSHPQQPVMDEALDIWNITNKLRSVLERMLSDTSSTAEHERQVLERFYGSKQFKCTRISCYYYHEGFDKLEQKTHHVRKHERPFFCIMTGCYKAQFGCTTEDELKRHFYETHGIDTMDKAEFPNPPRQAGGGGGDGSDRATAGVKERSYACRICPDRRFTRQSNLTAHLRTHANEMPFACGMCTKRFTRKSDCNRHQSLHGDKKIQCWGLLKNGGTWGCGKFFSRADKRADHVRSQIGRECIRPLLIERMQELREAGAPEAELDPDAIFSAGIKLPTFEEFLRLCGLDKSTLAASGHSSSPATSKASSPAAAPSYSGTPE